MQYFFGDYLAQQNIHNSAGNDKNGHNIHKLSYSTLTSKDDIADEVDSHHHNFNLASNDNKSAASTDKHTASNHPYDLSQLTVNDTTISSSDNDILLDPLSFDDNNTASINHFDICSLTANIHNPLTLNDLDNIEPTTKDNDEIDYRKDHVHDYLNIVGIENNQLTLNDIYIDLNSDFNVDLGLDLHTDTNSSISYPLLRQLNINSPINSPNNSHPNSKPATANSNIVSSLSTNSHSNSNLDTPHSKLLSNNDISINRLKRSFTRLKQTSELINTEKVYICSLKILEQAYLNHFMSDTVTPIYFDIFKNCVTQLLNNHQTLYDDMNKIYSKWFNDSVSILNDTNFEAETNANSPNFDKFNYVSNEKEYLEGIVRLLANRSIDVETYSLYCSLFQRILSFSSLKGIENYKRDLMVILNDYLVDHQNLEADYFVDQHLDTRFISVVQMPTNRMVRYKLILQSLLKNIETDEKNASQLNYYSKAMDKINVKIDEINSFVGNEDLKLEKLSNFKKLISKNSYSILPNDLFLENLENLQLSSSFGVVYPIQYKYCSIQSEYLCGFLLKSHLIFAKPSNLISNSLDIKFIIPLLSVFNDLDDSPHNMFSNYDNVINLRFENKFNIYEICLVFPDEKEKLLWKGQLKVNLDKMNTKNNKFDRHHDFLFSDIQSKILSIDLNPEIEKFNVSSYIPQTMVSFIKVIDAATVINDDIYNFEVDHFFSESNNSTPSAKVSRRDSITSISSHYSIDTDNHSIRTRNSIMNNNTATPTTHSSSSSKTQNVKITLQERVSAQTCIKSVWSQQFQIYTLNPSISRSLSNLFHSKMSLLSLNGSSSNINESSTTLNTPGTPTSSFIPPSPSFALNGSSLGSPIKLRNARSIRGLRDAGRGSIRNSGLPPTPSSYVNDEFGFDSPNSGFMHHHGVKHSGSLRSLSSFIGNGVSSSAKSIISTTTINQVDTNTNTEDNKEKSGRDRGSSITSSLYESTQSLSVKKGTTSVSKFWKSFKHNKKVKG